MDIIEVFRHYKCPEEWICFMAKCSYGPLEQTAEKKGSLVCKLHVMWTNCRQFHIIEMGYEVGTCINEILLLPHGWKVCQHQVIVTSTLFYLKEKMHEHPLKL